MEKLNFWLGTAVVKATDKSWASFNNWGNCMGWSRGCAAGQHLAMDEWTDRSWVLNEEKPGSYSSSMNKLRFHHIV